MAFECDPCAKLSIGRLVELARLADQQLDNLEYSSPKRGYYQHHRCLKDLELSAEKGCNFCQLMLESIKNFTQSSGIYATSPVLWNGPSYCADDSLYALAKSSLESDIKLCIWASHVFDWDPLDLVRVFDLIIVQKIADKPIYLGNYRIGRFDLEPNLSAEGKCAIAKEWLESCQKQHSTCPQRLLPVLPTRVIDVAPTKELHGAVLVNAQGRKGEYVALSHCWGGPITPVLDATTLGHFQINIPYDALPSNFQDAITITRGLGIRYLWIDSLCILQDSKGDWERESKMMGLIYRNSTVTIYGSASRKSTDGILRNKPFYQGPRPLYMRIASGQESFNSGPLASRGWTLQESALPPRQILYGNRGLFWKCPQGFQCAEGLPSGGPRNPTGKYSAVTSALLQGLQVDIDSRIDTKTTRDDYYRLVMIYSRRSLTMRDDKLPAFSGLAQSLHPTFGGEYIAGLWTADLNHGLTWRSLHSTCQHISTYRAPSWSWAVTDEEVLYPSRPCRISPLDLRLMEFDIRTRDPSNPYGEVTYGELIVSGRIIRLVRSFQTIDMLPNDDCRGSVMYDDVEIEGQSIDGNRQSLFRVLSSDNSEDDYLISISSPEYNIKSWKVDSNLTSSKDYLLLLINFGGLEDDNKGDTLFTAADFLALGLLKSTDGVPTYERVGFAYLDNKNTDWIRRWKTETLRLI
ncbi:HET-domain-containing protein [Camillea tinctor]|nr:HET-domain-containing protein [Camillea tinctor]